MHDASVTIAIAGSSDLESIVPLMQRFNHEEGIPWNPEVMVPALRRLLDDSALGALLVARTSDAAGIAGYGIATFGYDIEFAGRDAFITELFVEASKRGRGVGRALLEALIDHMRHRGAGAVHLVVRPENERAKALYLAQGFEGVPRQIMTKRLASSGP